MTSLSTGGGTGAVAASAHAGCDRFRRTDPLIIGVSRKALSAQLGFVDRGASIPQARWARAMTFESLVQSERFVNEVLIKAIGQLGLPRPGGLRCRSGKVSVDVTAQELAEGHLRAVHADEATMVTSLAVPYLDMESHPNATPVKPDFAIIAPRSSGGTVVGSWLVMGDAKDYERVRSRIDDSRMLKGFLQVALGAESVARWSRLPTDMRVHPFGALAVPHNSFLQPEAVVEQLADHRSEVRTRAEERLRVMAELGADRLAGEELPSYVAGIEAAFDPASCATCNFFAYCRHELRNSDDPLALLAEIGVDRFARPAVRGLVDGSGAVGKAPARLISQVRATVSGVAEWVNRSRTDPVGLPGSINVVIAKSDGAALGVYGLAVRRVTQGGPGSWKTQVYAEPQSPQTRLEVMAMLGRELEEALASGDVPLHLVVPDQTTADVLVSIADSLAGVELSRLRWLRDLEAGRPVLTFDGEEAAIPDPLAGEARLAVSFLLEEDRARAMSLRQPLVSLREVLDRHLVAGGPAFDSGRLDYLVRWAEAGDAIDHRVVSDEIAAQRHTPGARLGTVESNDIHRAHQTHQDGHPGYDKFVRRALDYKTDIVDRAVAVLSELPISSLRNVHRALEQDAQVVWRRRVALEASDLVRFSRTHRTWRDDQVEMLEADAKCFAQLEALADSQIAMDMASDAGTRELARARVLSVNPLRLDIASRRIVAGSVIVALHVAGTPLVESPSTMVKIQRTGFKLGPLPIGRLVDDGDPSGLLWRPIMPPTVDVGDELIVADGKWFGNRFGSGREVTIKRPEMDTRSAPKADCTASSYAEDPAAHRWCCRPHTAVEAEWADQLAARRDRGELNPQVWPPVTDEDRFDVGSNDETAGTPEAAAVPAELTLDDIE